MSSGDLSQARQGQQGYKRRDGEGYARSQVRVDDADDLEALLDQAGQLSDPLLVGPGDVCPESVHLALLVRLHDGLDDRLDAHRHALVRLVPSDEPSEPLRTRPSPPFEETVDQAWRGKLDVVDQSVWLRLERDCTRLAL